MNTRLARRRAGLRRASLASTTGRRCAEQRRLRVRRTAARAAAAGSAVRSGADLRARLQLDLALRGGLLHDGDDAEVKRRDTTAYRRLQLLHAGDPDRLLQPTGVKLRQSTVDQGARPASQPRLRARPPR